MLSSKYWKDRTKQKTLKGTRGRISKISKTNVNNSKNNKIVATLVSYNELVARGNYEMKRHDLDS